MLYPSILALANPTSKLDTTFPSWSPAMPDEPDVRVIPEEGGRCTVPRGSQIPDHGRQSQRAPRLEQSAS
eukprot:scaffold165479_cov35-Tisochrysis_lutea.AAC.6